VVKRKSCGSVANVSKLMKVAFEISKSLENGAFSRPFE
jgi:hypothetical protein